jgi:hypothetical protein
MCALEAYRKSPNPVLSINLLIDGLTDINFAQKLKKYRTKCILYTTENELIDPSDIEEETFPVVCIEDVGDVFNYAYYFFWKEEEEDDLTNSELPLNRISELDRKRLRESLLEILPDDIPIVEEEEILFQNSSSSGLDPITMKSKPVYILKETCNKFDTSPSITKRSFIHVYPCNTRDSVIQSVARTNSIKLIEKQVQEIVEETRYSLHFRNPEKFDKHLQSFFRENNFFFNRDILKEGITKPREILKIILEVLLEKYPRCPAWKYRGIFDEWIVYDPVNETVSKRKRGHGLGMANSLTTLMQAAIFNIIINELLDKDTLQGKIDAIFLNDDASIGFETEDDFDTYIDFEEDVFERYGLLRKLSKSHKGLLLIFCENYFCRTVPNISRKTSYKLTEIFNIFAAQNIVHAKMISGNLSKHILLRDIDYFMDDITRFWSYEFYPEEAKKPTLFGGWLSPAIQGIRIDFELYSGTYKEQRAVLAITETAGLRKKVKGSKRTYLDAISRKYPSIQLPEELERRFNIRQPISSITEKMARFGSMEEAEASFIDFKERRQHLFKEKMKTLLSNEELYHYVRKNFENKDFLPPKSVIGEIIYPTYISGKRKYRSANPLLSMIKFFHRGMIPNNIIPEKFSALYDINICRPTSDERREVYRYIKYGRDTEISLDEYYKYNHHLFEEGHDHYLNPENLRAAAEILWGIIGLPIPRKDLDTRFNDEEIALKKLLLNQEIGSFVEVFLKRNFIIESIDFYKEVQKDLQIKLSKKRETSKQSLYKTNTELSVRKFGMGDYWTWKYDTSHYKDPFTTDPIEQIFVRIDSYLDHIRTQQMFELMSDDRRPADLSGNIPVDLFMKHVWLSSGGKVDDTGDLITRSYDVFDAESDDDEGGGLLGFFGD